MVAGIVPTIMNLYLSRREANYYLKELMKKVKKKNKPAVKEPLKKALPAGTKEYSFFQDVYDVVRQIPKGRVTSYGAIAAYLGTRLSARMVGWAMNAAGTVKPKVPAQRVVNRNGMLSGKHHFGSPTTMEELLKKEKVYVKNDTVIDFKAKFWDPAEHLSL